MYSITITSDGQCITYSAPSADGLFNIVCYYEKLNDPDNQSEYAGQDFVQMYSNHQTQGNTMTTFEAAKQLVEWDETRKDLDKQMSILRHRIDMENSDRAKLIQRLKESVGQNIPVRSILVVDTVVRICYSKDGTTVTLEPIDRG